MLRNNRLTRPRRRLHGAFVGLGVGMGSMVGVITGDWVWMPVVLAGSVAVGALAGVVKQCLG